MPKYTVEIEHKHIYVGTVEAPDENVAVSYAWELFEEDKLPLAWDDFWVNDVEEVE